MIQHTTAAAQILERESSIRKSRNRPLAERSYEIHLVMEVKDPEPKDILGKSVGIDAGKVHAAVDSDDNYHDRPVDALQPLYDDIAQRQERQKRLKRGSRQWNKQQAQIRNLRQKIANIQDNWEHHTAKAIAESNDVVIVEKLQHNNMRRGTRGTLENPAKGAAAKTSLNRSLGYVDK